MRRSIKFIIFFLSLFCIAYNPIYAGIFENNKNFEINKFVTFDIANYQFEDHEKILGKNSRAWNGEADQLPKDAVDTKEINVIVNGKSGNLRLTKYKEYISLNLYLDSNISCANAEEIVPKKYIQKENYYTYENTFLFLQKPMVKTTKTRFSIESGLSRIHFSCFESFFTDDKKEPLTVAWITNKTKINSDPKVVPIKPILCTVEKLKTKSSKWVITEPEEIIFHLVDSDEEILDKNFFSIKSLIYDKNSIHTSEKNDYSNASKNKVQVLEREHIIDRLTGMFTSKIKSYLPPGKVNESKILEVKLKGKCEKMSMKRKF